MIAIVIVVVASIAFVVINLLSLSLVVGSL